MTTSSIAEAIKGLDGPAILAYLAGVKWKAAPADPAPVAPGDPGYGQWYNEVRDQGVGYAPGTWDEVRYLWNTGVIDDATYQAAYRAFLADAKPAAAAPADSSSADAGDGAAEPEAAPADAGPGEGKRLSFTGGAAAT